MELEWVGQEGSGLEAEEDPLQRPTPKQPAATVTLSRRAALAGGLCLVGFAAACALTRSGSGAGRVPGRAVLTRGDVSHLVAEFHDPLSTSAAGMPGMPMGMDGEPLSTNDGASAGNAAGVGDGGFGTQTPAAPGLASGGLPGTGSCATNEELYVGNCYMKCSLLTNGTYSKRIAPNGCCKEASVKCMLASEVDFTGIFAGQGYNVDGDQGKPHPPGLCDGNEELFAGICYKKCSILTSSEYKMRSGPNTCCKQTPCWNPFNVKTSGAQCSGFGVGGGIVGGHTCPHSNTPVAAGS